MSISNIADENSITDTMSTIDIHSSVARAISESSTLLLLRLPLELQRMIWDYVIADCNPAIGPAVSDSVELDVWRVSSADDKNGVYSPHPLCYVCKVISTEVRNQIYHIALFTINTDSPRFDTRMLPQITRPSLTMRQAFLLLKADMPFVKDSNIRPKKYRVLSNLPAIKYLELTWCSEIPKLVDRKYGALATYQRKLARPHFFRRPFEVIMRFLVPHSPARQVICTGVVTYTSTKSKYEDGFEKDSRFERRLAHYVCAGDSKEEKERLDSMIGYINCCWAEPSYYLGDASCKDCSCATENHYRCRLDFDE